MKLEIYPEICCELCNEVAHNHFDCPKCKTEYAGTDIYGEIETGDVIVCEVCGKKYKISKKICNDEVEVYEL